MAVKSYTVGEITPTTLKVTWNGLQNGDTGTPLPVSQWAIMAYEITGTGGTGGQLTFEFGLSTAPGVWSQRSPFTTFPETAELNQMLNGAFRPNITGGDGSTNLALTIILMPYTKKV